MQSKTADFAPSDASWRTDSTEGNMHVVSNCGSFSPLLENLTSFIKPEVHNVLHCRQLRTAQRLQATCRENLVKFGRVVSDSEICELTDKQAYKCMQICWSQYFAPLLGQGNNFANGNIAPRDAIFVFTLTIRPKIFRNHQNWFMHDACQSYSKRQIGYYLRQCILYGKLGSSDAVPCITCTRTETRDQFDAHRVTSVEAGQRTLRLLHRLRRRRPNRRGDQRPPNSVQQRHRSYSQCRRHRLRNRSQSTTAL